MAVLFISEDYLKSSSAISKNVDVEELLPHIKAAQDIDMHGKLGTDLYNHLQDGVTNSTLSAAETTLIDSYIAPALVHWALYQAMPFLGFKIMNKSIVQKSSENAASAGTDDIKYLREIVRNTAEHYTDRLVQYLEHNQSAHPEYNTNTGADLDPSREAFYSGMNLATVRYKRGLTLEDFLDNGLI
jgi:hypothetical protein